MDQSIIRSLQGIASEAEEERLRVWRRASADNESRYRELARIWALMESGGPSVADTRPPSAEEIIARAEGRRADDRASSSSASTRRSVEGRWTSKKRIALAVASAAALVLLGLGFGELGPFGTPTSAFGATEVVTGALERATVGLRDGSVVRLAPNSRVRVTGEEGEREVWVDGRAYFSVVEKEGIAFRVNTRAGTAKVLGTRFAVDVQADTLRLVVEEGSVALGSGSSEVEVRAGQASVATGGKNPSVTPPVEAGSGLPWIEGFLAFQSTPLTRAAREIEGRFDIQVRILDDALEDETVTAWFTDQSAEQVLDTVCRIIGAHCTVNNGIATIEP